MRIEADEHGDAEREPGGGPAQVADRERLRLLGRQPAGSNSSSSESAMTRRRRDQGFGMPTVSGETLALPPSNSTQALAWIAGNTAFCAGSPNDGANSAPRLAA